MPPQYTFQRYSVPGDWDTTHGVVVAGGIERRAGPLRLAPEVRYTYWNKPSVDVSGSQGFSIQSSQHQVEILLGIRFP
jgi:hypothetical protein